MTIQHSILMLPKRTKVPSYGSGFDRVARPSKPPASHVWFNRAALRDAIGSAVENAE